MTDDDPVELSAHALSALNEFYRDQARLANDVDEDWELSQFWYDSETSQRLANECIRLIDNSGMIACVCCPTLYKALLEKISENGEKKAGYEKVKLILFEYDRRFARYGDDFVYFDYRLPLDQTIGDSQRGCFDVVVADPPFLSEECIHKVAQFVGALKKAENGKIIFCTGLVVEKYVMQAFSCERMRICDGVEIRHHRKLGNEFRCSVNYEGAFPS